MNKYLSKSTGAIALSTAVVTISHAQDFKNIRYDEAAGLIHNVHINIVDNVSDGCWTNVSAIQNRVTAKLEQAGIRTYDERLAFLNGASVNLYIEATGYRISNGLCVGSLSYDVGSTTQQSFGDLGGTGKAWGVSRLAVIYQNGAVFSGPDNLNPDMLDIVDSYTDELVGLIYKGRRSDSVRSLLQNLPGLSEEPMTQAEFEIMVRSAIESED